MTQAPEGLQLLAAQGLDGLCTAISPLPDQVQCESEVCNVRFSAKPGTVAHQDPLSMGFSRQEYWSGLAIPFSRGSSPLRDWNWVSCTAGRFFTIWAMREAPVYRVARVKSQSYKVKSTFLKCCTVPSRLVSALLFKLTPHCSLPCPLRFSNLELLIALQTSSTLPHFHTCLPLHRGSAWKVLCYLIWCWQSSCSSSDPACIWPLLPMLLNHPPPHPKHWPSLSLSTRTSVPTVCIPLSCNVGRLVSPLAESEGRGWFCLATATHGSWHIVGTQGVLTEQLGLHLS